MIKLKYPKSFPNKEEELFLKLVLSSNEDFPKLWEFWKKAVIFNNIDYAILKLVPILYLRLKELNIQDNLLGRIGGIYKYAWYNNQFVINSTKNTVSLLNKENIPAILLKGVPLIENVYKNRGARHLGDLDVLVDPNSIKKVIKIMIDNGWNYVDSSIFYKNRFTEPLLKNKIDKEVTFINDKSVQIDVHWSLFSFLFKENREHPMSYNEVLEYSIDCEIDGVKYKMPCMEDMIIHVIVHGSERNDHRPLRWVIDVVSIVRSEKINWEFFMERIKKFEMEIPITIAFSYLINNFSFPVPKSFINELEKLSIEDVELKKYYKKMDTVEKKIFGTLPYLWNRYWLYDKKGSILTSWYYFIDYACQSWGIIKKRQIPVFIFEKYKKRIKF